MGPFVFLDHMGPHNLPAGAGIDVAPHPHIELATVSYFFDGDIEHRDSLGSVQAIRPGDVELRFSFTLEGNLQQVALEGGEPKGCARGACLAGMGRN